VVRERALLTVVDAFATTVAGAGEESSRVIRRGLRPLAGSGRARVMGEPGLRVDPASAAAMNAASAHCLDYDSISLEVSGFVAGQTACALTALVEDAHPDTPGRDVITAFCLGWEVAAAVGRGVNTLHYAKGWHPTATLGLLAATAAACRLEGFDPARTATALGIAVSEASGVKTMIGNMLNPWHTGKAARNAVVATRLTGAGFQGHRAALEADQGFLNLFNGPGQWDEGRIIDGLGRRWDLDRPGPVFKIYPCCGLIHSGLDAVLALRAEHRLQPDEVRSIEVRVHEFVPRVMHVEVPADGYAAKFSIPYCVAAALLAGEVGLATFDDVDPRVVELGRRVHTEVHPDLRGGETFLEREFTEVILETAGGTLRRRVSRIRNRGTGDQFALADLRAKFGDCLAHGGRAGVAAGEWDRLLAAGADEAWDLWGADSRELSRHASRKLPR
jgi:2-methylcitrate dehydratase PrpD